LIARASIALAMAVARNLIDAAIAAEPRHA
jgi:hypothetical protein